MNHFSQEETKKSILYSSLRTSTFLGSQTNKKLVSYSGCDHSELVKKIVKTVLECGRCRLISGFTINKKYMLPSNSETPHVAERRKKVSCSLDVPSDRCLRTCLIFYLWQTLFQVQFRCVRLHLLANVVLHIQERWTYTHTHTHTQITGALMNNGDSCFVPWGRSI